MKQLSLLLVAVVAVWGLSNCDNAKLESMKAEQERMVDSLANAQIADVRAQLTEACDASVEEMIKAKVDSVQAAMASTTGSGKTNMVTPKPTPKPKPTTTNPGTVTPNTGGDGDRDLKDRRKGNVTTPTGTGDGTVTPNTGGARDLKDRRRGGGN